jgi:hypothetical protein
MTTALCWALATFSVSWSYTTVGLLGRGISPSQGLYLYTEQNKHRINAYTHQISMLWVGFEPTIPAFERVKIVHALDRAATVISYNVLHREIVLVIFIFPMISENMRCVLNANLHMTQVIFSQTVGLLGRVINPSQGRYLHTGQHKHRINAHTNIHALSGIRTHDPSVQTSEGSSCLWPRAATVIGFWGTILK